MKDSYLVPKCLNLNFEMFKAVRCMVLDCFTYVSFKEYLMFFKGVE